MKTAATQRYYRLTKPGIVYSNVMTAAAGFLFASRGMIDAASFFSLIIGIAFVIASACVFNNYIDRHIDTFMARTKKRATVTGEVNRRQALSYASGLGIIGFGVLLWHTNELTVLLGAVAMLTYVVAYGIAKRKSVHGTLVGTIPGALPLVAGYVTVTGALDGVALILFLIMVVWQMPHFYAIAMYRRDDYAAAKLPVLPVVRGMRATKQQIVAYVGLFLLTLIALFSTGATSVSFLVVMAALAVVWLRKGLAGFSVQDDVTWARGMFGFSLIVLLAFSALLSVDVLLP